MNARVLIAVAALFVPLSVFGQTVVVNPTTLSVSASSGSSVASQNVTIGKSGGGALRWSITKDPNNGSWVSLSQMKGTNSGTITVNFVAANMPASSGTYAIFTVTGGTSGPKPVSVNLTVAAGAPAPPRLTVACPADIAVTSSDGSPVVVNYTATTSGGVAPVSVTGTPPSGSSFSVGPTPTSVNVTARSSDG